MPWAKFDDQFDDDPDCDVVGTDGICLFLCSITWVSRNLTDGHVPEARARKLPGYSPEVVRLLLQVRWWVPVDGGYMIRNFLKFNKSKEQVIADRNHNNARQREFQERQRLAREQEEQERQEKERDQIALDIPARQSSPPRQEDVTDTVIDNANNAVINEAFNDAPNNVTNGEITPLVTATPVSRIPSPESRVPLPDTQPPKPPIPLPARASPPAESPPPAELNPPSTDDDALDAGCVDVLGEMLRFLGRAPTPAETSQAERVLKRSGCEKVRWQCAAMRWRETEHPAGHPRHVVQPWAYLLDAIAKDIALPAAVREQWQAETEAGQRAKAEMEREMELARKSAKGQSREVVAKVWEGLPPDVQAELEEQARERAIQTNPAVFRKQAKVDPDTWFLRPGAASVIQQQRVVILTERRMLPEKGTDVPKLMDSGD